MQQNFIISASLILLVNLCYSQSSGVTFDRPGIADSPFSIGLHNFQPEIGIDHLKQDLNKKLKAPNVLLRSGVTGKAELRIYAKNAFAFVKNDLIFSKMNVSPLGIGGKLSIAEQNSFFPYFGVMSHFYLPFYNNIQGGSRSPGFDAILLFQHNITEKFSFNYNIGYTREAVTKASLFMSSWCVNFLFTEKLGSYAEYYNFLPLSAKAGHSVDGGLMYLLTPLIQVDVSGGYSLNKDYFISAGIAVRINGH